MNQTQKPVVLVVMDGIGLAPEALGNAVLNANTPTLDGLMKRDPMLRLKAHGTAVGLPSDDDMGNSEVGHNALGCGQIYAQGAQLVNLAIETGKLYEAPVWQELIRSVISHEGTLHFIGLFSDGNVHSHLDHLKAMIARARLEGARKVRIHILLDGRDVPAQSALDYVDDLEAFLATQNGAGLDARIASGGGRMKITMDRYQADWKMVERGWQTHVLGRGAQFASAGEAILAARAAAPDIIDQDLPPFVIAENGRPIGTIDDGDSVIFFNFRGDRAIEISMAFDNDDFPHFDRVRRPQVIYAGMLEYDGDLHVPKRFLVNPPDIQNTLTELLNRHQIREFAISETQKFGHVTYFWNGNYSGKMDEQLEDYVEIPSDQLPFSQRPWMKAAEITDRLIEAIQSGQYPFLRCNFANGDMVGHTGNYDAAVIAVETVDLCLARLLPAVDAAGGILIVTADHGNADEMLTRSKKGSIEVKTAHTLNPVPFIIHDAAHRHELKTPPEGTMFGLANVAATVAGLLGIEAPEVWKESLLAE